MLQRVMVVILCVCVCVCVCVCAYVRVCVRVPTYVFGGNIHPYVTTTIRISFAQYASGFYKRDFLVENVH